MPGPSSDAVIVGEHDGTKHTELRDKRCRSGVEQIIEALRWDCRQLGEAIARRDQKLGGLSANAERQVSALAPPARKNQHTSG